MLLLVYFSLTQLAVSKHKLFRPVTEIFYEAFLHCEYNSACLRGQTQH